MLSEISIDGFRGLKSVQLRDLARINIITGDNSAGKTSILEAVYFGLVNAPQLSLMPANFRHKSGKNSSSWDNYWLWLFNGKQLPGRFTIRLKEGATEIVADASADSAQINSNYSSFIKGTQQGRGNLAVVNNGTAHGNVHPWHKHQVSVFDHNKVTPEADAERFSTLSSTLDGEDKILAAVKIIDPRIVKMRYLKLPNNASPLVYLDIGLPNLIPATQMGQGFRILFSLFLELLTNEADILLIDEFENGLHRDVLPKIWDGLAKVILTRNIQVFATTHSKECINAAHQAHTANEAVSFSHHILKLSGSNTTCESASGVL